jgi:hypothetical protein
MDPDYTSAESDPIPEGEKAVDFDMEADVGDGIAPADEMKAPEDLGNDGQQLEQGRYLNLPRLLSPEGYFLKGG